LGVFEIFRILPILSFTATNQAKALISKAAGRTLFWLKIL